MTYDKSKLYKANIYNNGFFSNEEPLADYYYLGQKYEDAEGTQHGPMLPWELGGDGITFEDYGMGYLDPYFHPWGVADGCRVLNMTANFDGYNTLLGKTTLARSNYKNTSGNLLYMRISGKLKTYINHDFTIPGGWGLRGTGTKWLNDPSKPLINVTYSGEEGTLYNWSFSTLMGGFSASESNALEELEPFIVVFCKNLIGFYISEMILVDVSQVFGRGNEPNVLWCDKNINYDSLEVDPNNKEDYKMRLVWDKTGERKYETGTKNGVLYVQDETGAYPDGVAWNGLTGVTESPSGAETTALYADDAKYLSLRSAEEFGGTINAYMYPEEFKQCDGTSSLAEGVDIGQQNRATFGFSYRTIIGNDTKNETYGYKLHLVYGATVSPSERTYETVNDSPNAMTLSWTFTTNPVNVTGAKPTSLLTVDSTLADPEKLAQLEDILYGKNGTGESDPGSKPRLPLPDEVASIFAAG